MESKRKTFSYFVVSILFSSLLFFTSTEDLMPLIFKVAYKAHVPPGIAAEAIRYTAKPRLSPFFHSSQRPFRLQRRHLLCRGTPRTQKKTFHFEQKMALQMTKKNVNPRVFSCEDITFLRII